MASGYKSRWSGIGYSDQFSFSDDTILCWYSEDSSLLAVDQQSSGSSRISAPVSALHRSRQLLASRSAPASSWFSDPLPPSSESKRAFISFLKEPCRTTSALAGRVYSSASFFKLRSVVSYAGGFMCILNTQVTNNEKLKHFFFLRLGLSLLHRCLSVSFALIHAFF